MSKLHCVCKGRMNEGRVFCKAKVKTEGSWSEGERWTSAVPPRGMRVMHARLAAVFAAVFLPAISSFAQGTKADYESAQSLGKRTDNKVFRTKVVPHWLPDGNAFWYRIETAPGVREVVSVDAVKGVRTVVTDVSKIPGAAGGDGTRLEDDGQPHPSKNGGDEVGITFTNKTAGEVRLIWLDTGGGRKAYGEVKAGASSKLSTYAGHVWLVEDAGGKTFDFSFLYL